MPALPSDLTRSKPRAGAAAASELLAAAAGGRNHAGQLRLSATDTALPASLEAARTRPPCLLPLLALREDGAVRSLFAEPTLPAAPAIPPRPGIWHGCTQCIVRGAS